MTRISKQGKLRRISKRRPVPPAEKSGPKKDNLPIGYRTRENAAPAEQAASRFIPKIS